MKWILFGAVVMAVRVAMSEARVVADTKAFLEEEGVDLEVGLFGGVADSDSDSSGFVIFDSRTPFS